jgi:hypothetical protein
MAQPAKSNSQPVLSQPNNSQQAYQQQTSLTTYVSLTTASQPNNSQPAKHQSVSLTTASQHYNSQSA